MYRICVLIRIVMLVSLVSTASMAQQYLSGYIEEGLASNIVLKQKNLELSQSLLALKEARSWFYPSAAISGEYTWAEGGRSIDFPVGDLLNPVYSTLNQLTQSNRFPQVENTSIQLMPSNFYDAALQVTYPVLNPGRYYNTQIKKEAVHLSELEIETYRTGLIFDIRRAYYAYCLTVDAMGIYESALTLVNRNLAVNESLVKNGKGLPANVLRAESEAEIIRTKLYESRSQRLSARSWFNFLLNRPLGDTIMYESLAIPADLSITLAKTPEVSGRSELRQIDVAGVMRQSELDLNRRYAIPRINAFLSAGIQDFNWNMDGSSRYAVAGVQVRLPLFEGFRNRIKIVSTKIDIENLSLTKEYTTRQFTVAASIARYNLGTAVANMQSATKQFQSARAYFNLIEKGYSEGINSLIEYMDARHQYTQSELQVRITTYKLLTAFADLERQTAISTIQ